MMDQCASIGLIKRTQEGFEAEKGFPRLFINIKDRQLKEIAKLTHPEVYKYINNPKNKIPDKLKNYFDTINDIKVNQIHDKQKQGNAFEKILGDKHYFAHDVMMYGKNKQTLFAAAKRQLKTAPTPSDKDTKDFIKYSTNIIEKEIGEYLDNFTYDFTQWYSHLAAAKQKAINPVFNYYMRPQNIIDYTRKQIKDVLSLEYEAICKSEIQDNDGKPRMVCAIPQNIKYTMGPVTWQLEEICAKHLNGYCGGKNLTEMAQQLNQYIDLGFTKIVEGDGSAFDNSQDVTLKALDRYIYNRVWDKVYHVPKNHFRKVANLHYKTMNVKYIDEKKKQKTYLKYKILGTVFSGDCDTTLANTIRMAMYNRFANEQSGLKYGKDFLVMSKGDDFSVLYKEYVKDELIQSIYDRYFLKKPKGNHEILDDRQYGIGQICKFLDFGKPNSFKFCSLRSWYINDTKSHITLTRDPSKLFNKALYSIKTKTYNPTQRYNYHIDMAISYMVNYKGIEIFRIMADAHFKEANYIKRNYDLKAKKCEKIKHKEVRSLLRKKEYITNIPFGYEEDMNRRLKKLLGITGREEFINLIYSQYWEQIKKYESVRKDELNIKELQYVNEQINAEFEIEELKSLVAQNKKNDHEQ